MDFSLSRDDQLLVDRARGLAAEFATRAREYDEAAAFPARNFERLREEGFLTLTVPRELGGHGFWRDNRFLPFYMVLEAIATGCASTAQLLQVHSHASGIVGYLGSDAQRRRILGDVVRRGALIASCGSETDPNLIKTPREQRVWFYGSYYFDPQFSLGAAGGLPGTATHDLALVVFTPTGCAQCAPVPAGATLGQFTYDPPMEGDMTLLTRSDAHSELARWMGGDHRTNNDLRVRETA